MANSCNHIQVWVSNMGGSRPHAVTRGSTGWFKALNLEPDSLLWVCEELRFLTWMLKLVAWIELIFHLFSLLAFCIFENSFPPPSSSQIFYFLKMIQDSLAIMDVGNGFRWWKICLRKLKPEALSSLLKNCILLPFWALVHLALISRRENSAIWGSPVVGDVLSMCGN